MASPRRGSSPATNGDPSSPISPTPSQSLRTTADLLRPAKAADVERPPDEVVLQASWSAGAIVVWAGGHGAMPASNDELATRLESCGGPAQGWSATLGVPLGGGVSAEAVSIQVKDALGWLIAVSADRDGNGLGPSLRWLARAALRVFVWWPAARSCLASRWVRRRTADPSTRGAMGAGIDGFGDDRLLASAMPGTVAALSGETGEPTTRGVIGAVVEAIVSEGLERLDLPARPPRALLRPPTWPTRWSPGWTALRSRQTAGRPRRRRGGSTSGRDR